MLNESKNIRNKKRELEIKRKREERAYQRTEDSESKWKHDQYDHRELDRELVIRLDTWLKKEFGEKYVTTVNSYFNDGGSDEGYRFPVIPYEIEVNVIHQFTEDDERDYLSFKRKGSTYVLTEVVNDTNNSIDPKISNGIINILNKTVKEYAKYKLRDYDNGNKLRAIHRAEHPVKNGTTAQKLQYEEYTKNWFPY